MEHSHHYVSDRALRQDARHKEMQQKPVSRDTFFSFKNETQLQRPSSVATEFVDTDFDDDDIISEAEDNSPRASLQSGQPSFTTVSSYDEALTPRSSQFRQVHMVEQWHKPTAGPRGPHLFRSSTDRSQLEEEDIILTLSPVAAKGSRGIGELLYQSQPRRNSPFQYSDSKLDIAQLVSWTPEMVAQSMLNAGIELSMADRFIENDINGAILITLKFEDLRELDIPSFGIRTKVWHQIQALRDNSPGSPGPDTPIENTPSREARRDQRATESSHTATRQSSRRRQRRVASEDDLITPMESVSIIGIEQVLPKEHHCSKGENCSRWRKQQRALEDFKRANPHINIQAGGTFIIAGDAGNPETARAINPNELLRPMSDAVPSVVASSDIMGTDGLPPLQYLHEATLRNMGARDPVDNVRQFLTFQQKNGNDVPPTPPYEAVPTAQPPHHGLRRLPRLAIPNGLPARPSPARAATVPPPQPPAAHISMKPQQQHRQVSPEQTNFVPYQMNKTDARSPELETPRNPYRFGTPFSEMDVPVTAVPIGPVARDASQSVPPDMNYRTAPINAMPTARSQSRASARRPSFPVLPALDENRPVRITSKAVSPKIPSPSEFSRHYTSPQRQAEPQRPQVPQQPMHAPPRFNYPWSPPADQASFERVAPLGASLAAQEALVTAASNGISHQGPMKKRKTRLLRNEWQDGYFTLKGTRLNMHKDQLAMNRTLEYVDIDDYAIACSSVASTSKLSAAFKAVSISHNREKSDPVGAFSFQLIPQDKDKAGARLRKRDSSLPAGNPNDGVNGTGKTHHFAVKNRDDRIDWMRELMLAKAMKQKGDGFEISVNGNMI